MPPRRTALIALVLAAASCRAGEARADWGSLEGLYVLPGALVGASAFRGTEGGLVLGGELSLVRQDARFLWFGGYLDALYDFGSGMRLSVGPELGWSVFGVDAGYVLLRENERTLHGFSVRPLLTIGLIGIYARAIVPVGAAPFMETGALFKYPIEL